MTKTAPSSAAELISRLRRLLVLFLAIACTFMVVVETPVAAEQLTTRIIIALPLLLAGLAIRFWATWHIAGRKTRELVTSGPYARTRNPLYLGSALAVIALIVGLATPLTGAVALVGLGIIYGATIKSEEARLRLGFGAIFDAYTGQVPRFLPSLKAYKPAATPAHVPAGPDTGRGRVLWREAYTALGFTLATAGAFMTRQWLDGSPPFQP